MNSNSQSNGLSQVAEFQQGPDGGLYVEGVDELGQPLTQVGGSPPSQFSTESQVNTFLDYQLTRHDNSQDMDTGAYRLPGDPVGCPQMPVLANPYGSDDPQAIPNCFRPSQLGQPSAEASGQSDGPRPGCLVQPAQSGYSHHPR